MYAKKCAGHCKKLLKRNAYHKDQWKLAEGVAKCTTCHTKRCWECGKLKQQDAFADRVWRMSETSSAFRCQLCLRGAPKWGMWRCAAKRCAHLPPRDLSSFSICIERAKQAGKAKVPTGSRRCDNCVRKFEEELQEQARRSHNQVQKPSKLRTK